MHFSVVTPSYKQLDLLNLCIASVRDQVEGSRNAGNAANSSLRIEHIVQDANSPGIEDFARNIGAAFYRNGELIFQSSAPLTAQLTPSTSQDEVPPHYQLKIFCESDLGMYDAINKGFRKASGSLISWLNCDEQYLPGTLPKVQNFFDRHPNAKVLFGDAILINEENSILCYRKAILPTRLHIQLSHLNTLSCSTFLRRDIVESGHTIDISYKAIADARWMVGMLNAKIPMAVLNEPLATFTITQSNLSQSSLAYTEMLRWKNELGWFLSGMSKPVIAFHRIKKLLSGAYGKRSVKILTYSGKDNSHRSESTSENVPFIWPGQTQGLADNFSISSRKKSLVQLLLRGLLFPIAYSICLHILDNAVPGVTLTPFLSIVCLLSMAFFFSPATVALAAGVFSISVLMALQNFGNVLPQEQHSSVFVAVRLASFIVGETMAILFSTFRQRAAYVQQMNAAILSHLPVPVVISDATGIISFANRHAQTLFKMAQTDILGEKWAHLVMANQDEGDVTRDYVEFFWHLPIEGRDQTLHLINEPEKNVRGRLMCLGQGNRRFMITVIPLASSSH